MKKTFLLLIAIAFTCQLFAQNSTAVLFTENGERFQLVVNGVIQNEKPQTNVKVANLNNPNYKLKVLFEDKTLGEIDKNLYLEPNAENTYCIKRNNSGEWVVRVQSITPIDPLAPAPAYTPANATTTTTTVVNNGYPNDNINMNLGVNGMGINMNVNGNVNGTSTTQSTTTYTTTTTTGRPNNMQQVPPPQPMQQNVYVMPGYTGAVGCPYPMTPQEFASVKNSISSKTFENTKMDMAKQILNQRCMTAEQVKELISLFTFENTKLDFAKYAYARTFDIGNYYMVNDAFTFESSISDLNNYIDSYKR